MPQNDLLSAVSDVISQQLAPARVERVSVENDEDHDGDPILRITVVFSVEGGRLDSKKVLGLARHLREPLKRFREEAFPVFTFMTPEESSGAAA